MILIALALAPVFTIFLFVYLKDKYEREPIKHLIISFVLGVFSILPAVVIEGLAPNYFPHNPIDLANTFIWAFIIVAGSEELGKFIMLRWYAWRQKEFDEPYDGIVYGAVISLGFAAIENIFYVLDGGVPVGLLRMFTAVPAHASFGIIMGYYFGLAWQHKEDAWRYKLRGLFTAVMLHGVYDFFLMQNNYPAFALFSFIGLVISIRLSLKAIKAHQQVSPFNPQNIKEIETFTIEEKIDEEA